MMVRVGGGVAALAAVLMLLMAGVASADELRVRKSVTQLTAQERTDFVQALLALKNTPAPYPNTQGLSWYDQFVKWHVELANCAPTDLDTHPGLMGHNGPMFLPWHREFVLLFEDALWQVSGKDIAVPYWDWLDHSPQSLAKVFDPAWLGGDGDPNDSNRPQAVKGTYINPTSWPLRVTNAHGLVDSEAATTTYLARHLGAPSTLPSLADVRAAFDASNYDVAPYDDRVSSTVSFRKALEGLHGSGEPVSNAGCLPDDPANPNGPSGTMGRIPDQQTATLHNAVHNWVGGGTIQGPTWVAQGGTMTVNLASPNDPLFFLHHAQVDRLWAEWQALHGTDDYRPTAESDYPHNALHSPMWPFSEQGIEVTPADVESTLKLGYTYTIPPGETPQDLAGTSTASSVARWGRTGSFQLLCHVGL